MISSNFHKSFSRTFYSCAGTLVEFYQTIQSTTCKFLIPTTKQVRGQKSAANDFLTCDRQDLLPPEIRSPFLENWFRPIFLGPDPSLHYPHPPRCSTLVAICDRSQYLANYRHLMRRLNDFLYAIGFH